MKRPKKRGRPRKEMETFLIKIESWEWDLSFGVGGSPWKRDPYGDYRHLKLRGPTRYPPKLVNSAAEVILIPEVHLNESDRMGDTPTGLGGVTKRGDSLSAICSVPVDALPSLLTILSANRARSVTLHGEPLRYGKSRIKSIRVSTELDDSRYLEPDERSK